MTFMRYIIVCLFLLIPLYAHAEQTSSSESERTVSLEEVIYKSPNDWSITLNGIKITPTSARPAELIKLEVLSGEDHAINEQARLKWFDKKQDGVIDINLEAFQKYDLDTFEAYAIMAPPPQGITDDEWEWLQAAVTKPFNLSYESYQKDLQVSSKNFTKEGWDSFTNLLQKMHMLDSLQSLKQTAWSYLRAGMITTRHDTSKDRMSWIFKTPLSVKYQGAKNTRTDNWIFYITVVRNSSGLAIANWETPPSLH